MVTFLTLFIGLAVSEHSVETAVGDDVAAVEIRLDGVTIGTLTHVPWKLDCDFGDELRPHELVAVARDENGDELGRARQWINLPRALAESSLVLEADAPGPPSRARLIWQSMETVEPEHWRVTFDGKPLAVDDPRRFALPSYDPRQLHMLAAELELSVHVRTRAGVILGGGADFGATVTTELTAVPLTVTNGAAPASAAELEGRLLRGDEPLRVMALESEGADVLVVQDRGAEPGLRYLAGDVQSATLDDDFVQLGEGERVRFLFAESERRVAQSMRFDVFPMSQALTAADGRLDFIFTHVSGPDSPGTVRRLADAVANAAVQAAAGNRPRAVVLILGRGSKDASRFTIDEVQSFLATLRVPLVVWTTGLQGGASRLSEDRRPLTLKTPWGKARDISSFGRLAAGIRDLRAVLDSQVIAWVEGSHLPQDIRLSGEARGVELVR